MREIDTKLKKVLQDAGRSLKGHARRLFMARAVNEVFEGVAYRAEQELGWNRVTVTKGLHELKSGVECVDGRRGATGRKPAEAHLPDLLTDIRDLVDSHTRHTGLQVWRPPLQEGHESRRSQALPATPPSRVVYRHQLPGCPWMIRFLGIPKRTLQFFVTSSSSRLTASGATVDIASPLPIPRGLTDC